MTVGASARLEKRVFVRREKDGETAKKKNEVWGCDEHHDPGDLGEGRVYFSLQVQLAVYH